MGAETCDCGREIRDCLVLRQAKEGWDNIGVDAYRRSASEHWRLAYDIQRARADAAERERDGLRGERDAEREIAVGWEKKYEDAEATIATLREEVERLRREAALSPPQASTTTHPQEPEGTATPGGHHAR